MKYLLDTCAISDFFAGDKETVGRIKLSKPNDISISVITVSEIEYVISKIKGTKKSENIANFSEELFRTIKLIPLDYEIAKVAGIMRSKLEKEGKQIGAYDLLIAATAKHYNIAIVTSNIREFERVDNLLIENWRE